MKRFARWLFMATYRSELAAIAKRVRADSVSVDGMQLGQRGIAIGKNLGTIDTLESLDLLTN